MRPEKLQYLMRKAFDNYFENDKDVSMFYPLMRGMERRYKQLCKEHDPMGEHAQKVVFGSTDSYNMEPEGSCHYDMMYISDRWQVSFRLLWLMEYLKKMRDKGNVV